MADHRHSPQTPVDTAALALLRRSLAANTPHPTRRDLMRWSAIAGAAAGASQLDILRGVTRVAAAPLTQADFEADATIRVPFDAFGQAITLDPHRSADYGGFWVMFPNVWRGLLQYDEIGNVSLDMAEGGSISDDSLTYTFTLLPDLRYASGNPVLADHFVQSWRRALDPANLSPMAGFMQHVAGFAEYIGGDTSAELGFAAPDDRTVTITLSQPYSYFLSFLASFVWSVVDPGMLELAGDENFVLNSAGAGPWEFVEYELDSYFAMAPNPNFYAAASPSITRIEWPILTGPAAAQAAMEAYRADEAVSADVPLSLLAEVQADETLASELVQLSESAATVRSFAFDFRQAPFDDVRVRRAFALALDRSRYSQVYSGVWTPATSFAPPVLTTLSNYEPAAVLEYDVPAAQQLLADAGYPNGEGLPTITYYHPAGDTSAELDRVQSVLAMFTEHLGVTVVVDDSLSSQEIANLRTDAGGLQFDIIWWQNVASTPYLISQVLNPTSPYMAGVFNWSPDLADSGEFTPGADAQAFIDLMTQADVEQDEATRNDLYRQGEALAIANAVYVPIANWVPAYVQKPYLQGTRQGSWTGRFPIVFDESVVVRR